MPKTRGLFVERPVNVSGPKSCFMFAAFAFKIKVSFFFFIICLRVRKVSLSRNGAQLLLKHTNVHLNCERIPSQQNLHPGSFCFLFFLPENMGEPCIIQQKYKGWSHRTCLRENEFSNPPPSE